MVETRRPSMLVLVLVLVLAATATATARGQEPAAATELDVAGLLDLAATRRESGDLLAALDVLRQASRLIRADPERGERHPDNFTVLDMAAKTLLGLERYQAALPPLRKLASLRGDPSLSDTLSPEDRAAAAEVEALTARCLAATGDQAGARQALSRSRSLLEGAAAAPEGRVAEVTVAVAAAEELLGDTERAAADFAGVVSAHAPSLGLTHPAVAAALVAAPRIAATQGRLDAAATSCRAALDRLDTAAAGTDVAVVPLLRQLGSSLLAQDSYSEAEALFNRALAISSRAWGTAHPQALLDRVHKALVMLLRGRSRDAEATAQSVMAAAEALAEADDGRAGPLLRQLGEFFLAAGRLDRAERLFSLARDLDVRLSGEASLALAQDLLGLGRCLVDKGDAAAAITMLDKGLEIRRGQRPDDDEGVLQLVRTRAKAAAIAGDADGMQALMRTIVEARPPRRSRLDDERLADLFEAAAAFYDDRGDADRGRKVRELLVKLRSDQYGLEHPHVADVCMSFAVARQAAQAWDDAIGFYQRALAIWEAGKGGAERPEVAAVLMPMAQCLQATNRQAEAKQSLERARAIWVRSLGPDHEVTRAAEALLNAAGGR